MILLGGPVAPKVYAQTAPAGPVLPPSPQPFKLGPLHHRHQTGLSLMPGLGYRIIVPYKDEVKCTDSSRDASKRVCTAGVPLFLDLQLSFGITERLDVITDLRFGLVKDINQQRQFAIAPGIRVWLDPELNVKFYTTVQGVYDHGDYEPVVPNSDFGLRNSNGLMYDLIRNVGLYIQVGETVGFRRWFRIELDVGLGVQVRFP
jgi:hypothetical protein